MYFRKTPSVAKYIYKEAIWSIPSREKILYLTFDDGPTLNITDWVLDELNRHKAKATFFCIGQKIEENPELFRKILERGHRVGNHTFNHLNGWKTKKEEYFRNIEKCEDAIRKCQSESEKSKKISPLFRPPYGKILTSQASYLKSKYSILFWDVLSGDFDQTIDGSQCFKNVVENVVNGSIVVFHDSEKAGKNLCIALPRTLNYFFEKGFRFETIPLFKAN